jgi:hypothetical protein
VAFGSWIAKYRYFFIATTLTLISYSFYRTYRSGCVVPRRNKIILWATMAVSISLTVYTIIKPYLR